MGVRIGVAQIKPVLADVPSNVEKHISYIGLASERGVDILVFPELSLTGYSLGWLVPQVSIRPDDPILRDLSDEAGDMLLVVGGVLEERDMFYNALFLLHRGEVLGIHRKVYLPTYGMFDESRFFAKGRGFDTFETHVGRVALSICEDAWHLDSFLSRADADLFVLSANNPLRVVQGASSVDVWHYIAALPTVYFSTPSVYVNRVGVEDGVIFFGASRILEADGSVSLSAPIFEEGLFTGEVHPHLRRAARYNSATLREHFNHAVREGSR